MKFLRPSEVFEIRDLELRARIVVEGFLRGLHQSPYHGFSVEFSEYRPYTQGDDLRFLDWRLLARTDRLYLKRFEDETNLLCHLLVDRSGSMEYGSGEVSKHDYAITLAAALARLLSRQQDAVGLVTFAEEVLDAVPPRHRPGHLVRILHTLERESPERGTRLIAALEDVAAIVRRRGMTVLISDLLAPLEGLERALGQLRARGQEVLVVRILDPREQDFDLREVALFEDLESGATLHIDPLRAQQDYTRRFAEHAEQLARCCIGHSIDLVTLTTDRPLEEGLLAYLQRRARRGRTVRRRAPTPGASA